MEEEELSGHSTAFGSLYYDLENDIDLSSRGGSVAVELGVGLDVVGVDRQGLGVQLIGSFIVPFLEGLVTLVFLGF